MIYLCIFLFVIFYLVLKQVIREEVEEDGWDDEFTPRERFYSILVCFVTVLVLW